jgi:hypothetical protein
MLRLWKPRSVVRQSPSTAPVTAASTTPASRSRRAAARVFPPDEQAVEIT